MRSIAPESRKRFNPLPGRHALHDGRIGAVQIGHWHAAGGARCSGDSVLSRWCLPRVAQRPVAPSTRKSFIALGAGQELWASFSRKRIRLPHRRRASNRSSPIEQTAMKMTEHSMKSWDGTPLFYRAWKPGRPTDKALLLFHRGHEHSGRWQEVVDLLKLDEFSIFAWDARGHGQSPGDRGSAENVM